MQTSLRRRYCPSGYIRRVTGAEMTTGGRPATTLNGPLAVMVTGGRPGIILNGPPSIVNGTCWELLLMRFSRWGEGDTDAPAPNAAAGYGLTMTLPASLVSPTSAADHQ